MIRDLIEITEEILIVKGKGKVPRWGLLQHYSIWLTVL
jgi:hypothetical protein